MKYLLDTDHISIIQMNPNPKQAILTARMAQHPSGDCVFSIVSFHEQMLGAHTYLNRARRPNDLIRGYSTLDKMLDSYRKATVLPFDAIATAEYFGLLARRVRVPTMDLRIASLALSRNLIVLTTNSIDFGRVPGLVIEDWTM